MQQWPPCKPITLVIANKPSKLGMMKRLLPILLLLFCSASLAESGAYRVEVIVFRNLEAVTDASFAETLRSFSKYPELQNRRVQETQPATGSSSAQRVLKTASDSSGSKRSDLPDDLHVVTQKSTTMDSAWRRLRSSKTYRPMVYSAWEQNRTDYYPPVRVHDQNIIDTQLRPPTSIMVADLAAEDPFAAYRSTFYQLDGSIQLRRSRFLHLFLDMEFREKQVNNGFEVNFLTPDDGQANATTSALDKPVNGVYTLKQNRQIRTGDLQYFDTPYFGALVFVSAISAK